MYRTLREYLKETGPTVNVTFDDGAIKDPNRFPLCGRKIQGAILFSDLPGYSKLGESYSPEECAYIVNHYFAWMEAEGIKRYGGIIDKFIGDEIMVVFSREFDNQDPLESALSTAKSMIKGDHYAFYPKIGIAEGEVFVCCIGSVERFDISVVGHTVNLAARCVSSLKEGRTIKVANNDINKINSFFSESEDWQVVGPQLESFKNVSDTQIIQVNCRFDTIPNFNYFEIVKENVKAALSSQNNSNPPKTKT